MSYRTALTALASLSVPGVLANYDIDAVPDALRRGQLPALLVLPIDTQEDRLFKDRGEGFEAIAFSSGARSITYTVTHLLIVSPAGTGIGLRSHLPTLITLIDAYFAALSDDVTLSGALLEPAQVRVEPGIFPASGVDYIGCAFRHTWLMEV